MIIITIHCSIINSKITNFSAFDFSPWSFLAITIYENFRSVRRGGGQHWILSDYETKPHNYNSIDIYILHGIISAKGLTYLRLRLEWVLRNACYLKVSDRPPPFLRNVSRNIIQAYRWFKNGINRYKTCSPLTSYLIVWNKHNSLFKNFRAKHLMAKNMTCNSIILVYLKPHRDLELLDLKGHNVHQFQEVLLFNLVKYRSWRRRSSHQWGLNIIDFNTN